MNKNSRKNCKSNNNIDKIEVTTDVLTGRAGLALFVRYLNTIGVFSRLIELFGKYRKNGKGQTIGDIFKQMFCFFMDGTSRHLVYFDTLKADEGYARCIETDPGRMLSSHAVKRFFKPMNIAVRYAFRKVLMELFLWRLHMVKPDVILLDVTMPHVNGLEALHRIVEKAPDCRVLFLTMHDDESYLRSALAAGGSGYVLKQSADSVLLSAIRAVHQGGTYLHPEHTQVLLDRNRELKDTARHLTEDSSELLSRLSSREQEVLRLIAMGYTNKQAADQLFLSVKTVETYKARLMTKLDLHSRAELVCFALEHGLMTE